MGPGPGIRQFLTVGILMQRLLTSVHNLGWEITDNSFPEKTPEESDGFSTPHENRELSAKLGGN